MTAEHDRAGSRVGAGNVGDERLVRQRIVVARDGELVSQPMIAQGSGVSTSMIQANGLVIVETGITKVEAGSMVPTVMVGAVQ